MSNNTMTHHMILERLLQSTPFNENEANQFMQFMLSIEGETAAKGAALALLKVKGVTAEELAYFARYMREQLPTAADPSLNLVDTCGTGGGIPSFNISTAAAIIASAAGANIAKHGNRAVTSKCGSADVLEFLGMKIEESPEKLRHQLDEIGIAFLFAPSHHPLMKNLATVRKSLGIRTVFNQLGPLSNPFRATRQVLGVFDQCLVLQMAQALKILGTEHAFVVHSEEGLDEISPCGVTCVGAVEGDEVWEFTIHPGDFGLKPISLEAILPGETVEDSARILKQAVSDIDSLRCQACLPSAAAALVVAGIATDWRDGAERALEAVRSQKAKEKLNELVHFKF